MPVQARRNSGKKYSNEALSKWDNGSWEGGYNSYAQSQSQIKDTEFPAGQNVKVGLNGEIIDRDGKAIASPLMSASYPISCLGQLKKTGVNVKLALHGTTLSTFTDSTRSDLTGFAFTPAPARDCKIVQAVGRSYVVNGIDQPYWTDNGITLNLQSGAFPLKLAVPYLGRLYGVRPAYPDRIYFSNSVVITQTAAGSEPTSYDISNFGTFSVDYTATPKKNAGFIQLGNDEGIVIISITKKGSGTGTFLRVRTLEHGTWEVFNQGVSTTDSTVIHSFNQVINSGGCPAPLSVFPSDNDELSYGGDDLYFYGEVRQFSQPRTTAKSGRIHTEMTGIPPSAKPDFVGISFNRGEYCFWTSGSYNDRAIVRDKTLDTWSSPYVGWNVSCVFVYSEPDGRQRLLAGSSNPADPRIYELEVGTTDAGSFIDAWFSDKNTDVGFAGVPKYFAFSQVFATSLTDRLDYEPKIDGISRGTKPFVVPGVASAAGGTGTQATGVSATGVEGSTSSYGVPVASDFYFAADHGYLQGDKIQMIYRKGSSSSRFRVAHRQTWFKKGKPVPDGGLRSA